MQPSVLDDSLSLSFSFLCNSTNEHSTTIIKEPVYSIFPSPIEQMEFMLNCKQSVFTVHLGWTNTLHMFCVRCPSVGFIEAFARPRIYLPARRHHCVHSIRFLQPINTYFVHRIIAISIAQPDIIVLDWIMGSVRMQILVKQLSALARATAAARLWL